MVTFVDSGSRYQVSGMNKAVATAPNTNAVFSTPGIYQLQLAAVNSNGGTNRTLAVTVLSNQEAWRQIHFNTIADAGNAANSADPDSDGLNNLLEFATGTLPAIPDASIVSLTRSADTIDFTYRRSHAAAADGVEFVVEWSNSLSNGWSPGDVTQSPVPDSDNGVSTLWKATLPAGADQRFVRLKTTSATR